MAYVLANKRKGHKNGIYYDASGNEFRFRYLTQNAMSYQAQQAITNMENLIGATVIETGDLNIPFMKNGKIKLYEDYDKYIKEINPVEDDGKAMYNRTAIKSLVLVL